MRLLRRTLRYSVRKQNYVEHIKSTADKMKFSVKDFLSKLEQITVCFSYATKVHEQTMKLNI